MSQIKIYALHQTIQQFRTQLSDAIHQALVTSLDYPVEKKFQRFIGGICHQADRQADSGAGIG